MGHQISNGKSSINFTDGAWLVVHWCAPFMPPEPEFETDAERACFLWDQVGLTDIPAESAKKADAAVPREFDTARRDGFLNEDAWRPRRPYDEDTFRQCREFLRESAADGLNISGSY